MASSSSAIDNDVAVAMNEASRRYRLIPNLAWPDGIQVAVNFTVDFDAMLRRRLSDEPPMQMAKGEFGGRVGIWRLIDFFNRHDIIATIFTVGRICELYPASLRRAAESGHEIADHMWEHRVPEEPEIEAAHLRRSTDALAGVAGRRPVGTRSGHSLSLLKGEGYLYTSDARADSMPYYRSDASGENTLLDLPWHPAIDDAMFFNFGWLESTNIEQRLSDPERVLDLWWSAFMNEYRRGGYLNIVLHPFVSGRALRIAMLDRLVQRMKALPGVWLASCEAVARHCLDNHPPADPV